MNEKTKKELRELSKKLWEVSKALYRIKDEGCPQIFTPACHLEDAIIELDEAIGLDVLCGH